MCEIVKLSAKLIVRTFGFTLMSLLLAPVSHSETRIALEDKPKIQTTLKSSSCDISLLKSSRPFPLSTLRLMTYNVKNLFTYRGKFDRISPTEFKRKSPEKPKPISELLGVVKVLNESNPEVVVLQEVDDIFSLHKLNKDYLGDRFHVLLIEGNDARGIDVGFMVLKSLKVRMKLDTYRHETWADPAEGDIEPLFSRDFPILRLYELGEDVPFFVIAGVHGKSQRDRRGDPQSVNWRTMQYQRSAEIVSEIRNKYGAATEEVYGFELPFVIAGDFNVHIPEAIEMKPFWQLGFHDTLELRPHLLSRVDRTTHTYHPRQEPAHLSQMDGILVSSSLAPFVNSTQIIRYTNKSGKILPIPQSYKEREKNPSDHYPLIVDLNFKPLN